MNLLKIINESSILDDITAATIKDAYQMNFEMSEELQDRDPETLEDYEKEDLKNNLEIMHHLQAVYHYFTGVELTNGLG